MDKFNPIMKIRASQYIYKINFLKHTICMYIKLLLYLQNKLKDVENSLNEMTRITRIKKQVILH